MSIVPKTTVYLIIFSQKCSPKTPKTFFVPKNLNPRIQNQPHHMTMQQSHLRKTTERIKRRDSGVNSEIILESGKSRLRSPVSIPLMSQRKRRRCVTLVKSCISIMIKKAILSAIASSQKTSVSLGNLHTSD